MPETRNTEVLGLSAEKAICNLSEIEPKGLRGRIDSQLVRQLTPVLAEAIEQLPTVKRHEGSDRGATGGASKSSVDFRLANGATLSVKSNKSKSSAMVCPPRIGQGGARTYSKEFRDLYSASDLDSVGLIRASAFKRVAQQRIADKLERYFDALFGCDYLLWVWLTPRPGYRLFRTAKLPRIDWGSANYTFSKSPRLWIESCSVRYQTDKMIRPVRLGEFQIHANRTGFKFRFNMLRLAQVLDQNE